MKRLLTIAFLSCLCMAAEAKLVLGGLFADGLVLQQNTKAAIWGTASPGAPVSVSPSWNGTSYRGKADADGRWKIFIDTPAGSYKAHTLSVKGDGSTVRINDVLVGEVWMASGQSNMEMPMRGFFNCPVENAIEFISAPAATQKIRMFNVPKAQSYDPVSDIDGQWQGACSSTVPEMSATAYFFALELNQVLDVPVGIISAAYGGARVESWLPKEILEGYPDENLDRDAIEAMQDYVRPYLAYNAMFTPVKGYTVKGFIWYQGCSNVGRHDQFPERMTTLIDHWRKEWGDTQASLPFYMVEIAPYRYKPAGPVSNAALLRQAQHEVAVSVPNCGIVVTNDLVENYEMDNIHPAKKQEVGQRLAYLALNRDYGHSRISCYSPTALDCIAMKDSNELGVVLSHCDNGLNRWMEIEGLEVAGSEGVFYPVTYAYFEWETRVLRIRSEFVHDPCEVRYGWGDFKPGNLKNAEGLPVAPFHMKLKK